MAKGPGYGSEYRAKYPDKAKKSYEEIAREYGTRAPAPSQPAPTTSQGTTNIQLDPKLGYDKGRVLSDVKGVLDTSPRGTRASVRQYRETDAGGQLVDVTEVTATTPRPRTLESVRSDYASAIGQSKLLSLVPTRPREQPSVYSKTQIIARPGQSRSGSPLEPFYQKVDPFFNRLGEALTNRLPQGKVRSFLERKTTSSPTETFLTTGILAGTSLLQTSATGIRTIEIEPQVTRQVGELSVRETGERQLTASRTVQGVKYTKTIEGKGFETVGRASVRYRMPTGKEFTQEFSLGGRGVVADTGRTATLSRSSQGITISKEGEAFVFKGRMSADLISNSGLGQSVSNKVVGKGISFDEISTTESLSGGRLVRGRSVGVTKEVLPQVYEFRGLGRVPGQASSFAQRFKLSSAIAEEGGYSIIKGGSSGISIGGTETIKPIADSALKISSKQLTSAAGQIASETLSKIPIQTIQQSTRVSGFIGGKGIASIASLTSVRPVLATRTRLDQIIRLDTRTDTIQAYRFMQKSEQITVDTIAQRSRTAQATGQTTITIPVITPGQGLVSRGRPFGRPISPGKPGGSIYFAPPEIKLNFNISDIFGGFRGGRKYTRYTPSFGAIIFGIRGRKPKRTETGINLRPITKGFKFQGRLKL